MANDKALTDELKTAEDNLQNLIKQRDDLNSKIGDCELQLAQLDTKDTEEAARRVQNLTQRAEGYTAILIRVNDQLQSATNRVAAARRALNEAACVELREDEKKSYREAVKKLAEFEHAASKLAAVHKDLWSKKAPARLTFSARLIVFVAGDLEAIRHKTPELLGLPPALSPKEKAKKLAGMEQDRMQERVNNLENYPREDRPGDWDDVYIQAKRDLAHAKAAFEAF